MFASQAELFIHWAEGFDHTVELVFVFGYIFILLRTEQEVASHHLEDHTGQRKDIGIVVIWVA